MEKSNQSVDLELIRRIRANEEEAREDLVTKYVPMVKYIIRNYYSSFLDYEDLLQEGLIGLLNAIEEYKPEEYDVKFSTFAYICIIRRIYNVIKHTSGNKHRLLNEATSLQTPVGLDEKRMIIDFVEDRTHQVDPEEILEERLINDIIGQVLKNHLSLLEYAVITRILQGYTASEIEEEMGRGLLVIDYARTRVKTKLRRLIDEYGSLLSPQVPTNVRKRKDLYLNVPS